MQLDFHYYATYCAAFLAGYTHEESLEICYSAQLVDCCSRSFLSRIKGPKSAATTQEKLELVDAKADILSLQEITRIWASFHFLPRDLYAETARWTVKSYRNKYRLICGPNGELVSDTVELAKNDGSLQAVGIAMHILADTWAHQFFAGTPSLVINNTNPAFFELIPDPVAETLSPLQEKKDQNPPAETLSPLREKKDQNPPAETFSPLQEKKDQNPPAETFSALQEKKDQNSPAETFSPSQEKKDQDKEKAAEHIIFFNEEGTATHIHLPDGRHCTLLPIKFIHNPGQEDDPEHQIYINTFYQVRENSPMNLGHGRAGHLPDYSYARYRYMPAWGNYAEIVKDNPSDYYHAFCQMIYAMKYLRGSCDTFERKKYDTEAVAPWEPGIRQILEKRQTDASADWKAFAQELSGREIEDFDQEAYMREYTFAPEETRDDTFLGKFILAAMEQKSMVTNKIFKSGNMLAGFSIDFRQKGFKGIKDFMKLVEKDDRRKA